MVQNREDRKILIRVRILFWSPITMVNPHGDTEGSGYRGSRASFSKLRTYAKFRKPTESLALATLRLRFDLLSPRDRLQGRNWNFHGESLKHRYLHLESIETSHALHFEAPSRTCIPTIAPSNNLVPSCALTPVFEL